VSFLIWLLQINRKIATLNARSKRMATLIEQVDATVARIEGNVGNVAAALAALRAEVEALKAAGITEAQIAPFLARLDAADAATDALTTPSEPAPEE
jgi:chromosome segregation ATPase